MLTAVDLETVGELAQQTGPLSGRPQEVALRSRATACARLGVRASRYGQVEVLWAAPRALARSPETAKKLMAAPSKRSRLV